MSWLIDYIQDKRDSYAFFSHQTVPLKEQDYIDVSDMWVHIMLLFTFLYAFVSILILPLLCPVIGLVSCHWFVALLCSPVQCLVLD